MSSNSPVCLRENFSAITELLPIRNVPNTVRELSPVSEDARYNLAICQMQQENFETAVATFTIYIKNVENPEGEDGEESTLYENYGAYYYRAVCEEVLGKLEDALADYTVCIENGYELTQSYYQRAQVYAALGDVENQNLDLAESLKYAE